MRKTSDIIWQDTQHQVLFDVLELIKDPDSDLEVVLKLRDYTENHFTLEERYMEELEYPGLAEHVESHNRFRQEIEELMGQELDPEFRDLVATFLTEWLTRHVFGIDKQLEEFILASGAR